MRTPHRHSATFMVLSVLAFGAGCFKGEVIDLSQSGSGGAGNPSAVSAGGGTTGSPYEGVAMLWRDIPPLPPGDSGSSVSSGGGPDGDTLDVTFGKNVELACGNSPIVSGPCPSWTVSFQLPVELQQPGTLPLSDPRIHAHQSLSAQNSGAPPGDCYFGGGSFFDGSLEIVSLGGGELRFRITGAPTFEFDANGEHVVELCSDLEPPPASRALAYRRDAIPPLEPTPAGSSVSASTGGGPAPDDLLLVVTSESGAKILTCNNSPFGDTCPQASWSVYVNLPLPLQKPGTYSMQDLGATFSETQAAYDDGTCAGGGGSFFDGTLQVVSIEDSQVVVTLDGVSSLQGSAVAGTYAMPICK